MATERILNVSKYLRKFMKQKADHYFGKPLTPFR